MTHKKRVEYAKYRIAAKVVGWRLDPDGAFRNDAERVGDGLASFWYSGDWMFLCAEAGIEVAE